MTAAKTSSLVAILLLTYSLGLFGQDTPRSSYIIHAGGAWPIGPQPFSDFWKMGLTAAIGVELPSSESLSNVLIIEYASFPLDSEQFLAAQEISSNDSRVSGAKTSHFAVSASWKYHLGDPKTSLYYTIGGADVLLTTIGEGLAVYDGYTVQHSVTTRFGVRISIGLGAEFSLAQDLDGLIEIKYFYAPLKKDHHNTDLIVARIGSKIPFW